MASDDEITLWVKVGEDGTPSQVTVKAPLARLNVDALKDACLTSGKFMGVLPNVGAAALNVYLNETAGAPLDASPRKPLRPGLPLNDASLNGNSDDNPLIVKVQAAAPAPAAAAAAAATLEAPKIVRFKGISAPSTAGQRDLARDEVAVTDPIGLCTLLLAKVATFNASGAHPRPDFVTMTDKLASLLERTTSTIGNFIDDLLTRKRGIGCVNAPYYTHELNYTHWLAVVVDRCAVEAAKVLDVQGYLYAGGQLPTWCHESREGKLSMIAVAPCDVGLVLRGATDSVLVMLMEPGTASKEFQTVAYAQNSFAVLDGLDVGVTVAGLDCDFPTSPSFNLKRGVELTMRLFHAEPGLDWFYETPLYKETVHTLDAFAARHAAFVLGGVALAAAMEARLQKRSVLRVLSNSVCTDEKFVYKRFWTGPEKGSARTPNTAMWKLLNGDLLVGTVKVCRTSSSADAGPAVAGPANADDDSDVLLLVTKFVEQVVPTIEHALVLCQLVVDMLTFGYVHGDLRWANVLFTHDDKTNVVRVVIVDFDWSGRIGRAMHPKGLLRVDDGERHERLTLPLAVSTMIDPADDVYALGGLLCILFTNAAHPVHELGCALKDLAKRMASLPTIGARARSSQTSHKNGLGDVDGNDLVQRGRDIANALAVKLEQTRKKLRGEITEASTADPTQGFTGSPPSP